MWAWGGSSSVAVRMCAHHVCAAPYPLARRTLLARLLRCPPGPARHTAELGPTTVCWFVFIKHGRIAVGTLFLHTQQSRGHCTAMTRPMI